MKGVSLITGVAEGYYTGVLKRNSYLSKTCLFGAMPYGGEQKDHTGLQNLEINSYLFKKNKKLQFVYAGAMLPKAYQPLEELFEAISTKAELFKNVEFHFIGTGSLSNDDQSYTIRPLAIKYNIWESIVFEYPKRIPYLDVLIHLNDADAVFILGSTEPHYTPSKTYQAVLSQKPIWAILHEKSSASKILTTTKAGVVLNINGVEGLKNIAQNIDSSFHEFLQFQKFYESEQVDLETFNEFSAKKVTEKLVDLLNKII